MTDIRKAYLNPAEKDPIKQNAVIRQLLENASAATAGIFINVKDPPYSAQGDDSTDDTAAIQAAIDAASDDGGGTVFFPTGIYRHTGLTIESDCVTLLGSSGPIFSGSPSTGSRLLYMSGTGDHLAINGCSRAQILNLGLFGGVTATAGNAIHVGGGGGQDHLFDQVVIESCWNGILLEDATFTMLNFVNIAPNIGAEFGIKWTAATEADVLYLNTCLVRPTSASSTVAGYFIGKNTASVIAVFSGTDNCNYGWEFDDENVARPILGTLYGCSAEASTSHGFLINDILSLDLTDCYANVNGGIGIRIGTAAENVRVTGGQIDLNDSEGIYIVSGAFECSFNHCECQDNGQSGTPGAANVYVEGGTTNFAFIGGRFGGQNTGTGPSDNTSYGIQIASGASDYYRIVGTDVSGNATGGISDGGTGAHKVIEGNLGYAAPLVSSASVTTTSSAASMAVTDSATIFATGINASVYTLQSASAYPGRWHSVKNNAAFSIVSSTTNIVPLNGGSAGTTLLSSSVGKWATLQSNGTNWVIMASN